MLLRRSRFAFAVALLAGCASAPPPPPAPVAKVVAPPPRKLRMSAELGDIDQAATGQTVERVKPALMKCYADGLQRLEYMAGDMKFFMRVKADGHIRWVFFEQTNLGDRPTEACMLKVLSSTTWPLPDGGEAEVHQTIGFDAPADVRGPVSWNADRIIAAINEKAAAAAACKTHGAGKFVVTAYIGDESGAGKVLSAGAAPPSGASASDVDCVIDVARSMKVPTPGENPAKVSFSL